MTGVVHLELLVLNPGDSVSHKPEALNFQLGWLASKLQEATGICLSLLPSTEFSSMPVMFSFYMGAGNLDSDPQAGTENSSPLTNILSPFF